MQLRNILTALGRFCVLTASLCLIAAGAFAQEAVNSPPPMGIGLEEVIYPYPVHFLDLSIEGQALRMAYMDVPPTSAPNGKSVVLLHGKSFSGDYWAGVIKMLAERGYRVIVPDQLGFGKSAKPDIRYSFDLLARNTKALLDRLGIEHAAIVGHSFGGMLAVYFARDYPDLTQALVLENPIGLEDYRSAIPPQPLATLFKTEMDQTPESFRTFFKVFFVTWGPAQERYVTQFTRLLQSPEYPRLAKASALTYEMMYEEPIRHEYKLLKMPVLLIIGQGDRSVFFRRYAAPEAIKPLGNWPELGRAAAKELPDGKLVEIEGAGHVSHMEKPQAFEAALGDFLAARF